MLAPSNPGDFKLTKLCLMCFANGEKTEMLFHHSFVHHVIYDRLSGIGIYARDEVWKCPKCFWVTAFGVPITRSQYRDYIQTHGGLFEFNKPVPPGERGALRKRLVALGYMDVDK